MRIKVDETGRLVDRKYKDFYVKEVNFNDDLENYSVIFKEDGTENMLEFMADKEEVKKLRNALKNEKEVEIEIYDYQFV